MIKNFWWTAKIEFELAKKKESNLGKMLNIGKDVEQTQLPYAVMVKKWVPA